jgi:hypothetical protein
MGNSFGPYNAETNNCQDFITNIFKANGIGNESDFNFIKQDTKQIFSQLPEFSKVLGNIATQAGAIFNRLLKGEGNGMCEDDEHMMPDGSCMPGLMHGSGMRMYNYQLPLSNVKF